MFKIWAASWFESVRFNSNSLRNILVFEVRYWLTFFYVKIVEYVCMYVCLMEIYNGRRNSKNVIRKSRRLNNNILYVSLVRIDMIHIRRYSTVYIREGFYIRRM